MYRIGFDAKRLFHNGTGLGNYSRSLVSSLHQQFAHNDYVLFTPSVNNTSNESFFFTENFKVITPGTFSKIGWRSKFILSDLIEQNIDLYHGLSHELPFGIENTKIKSIVTIHDLIYKFFPEDFPLIDKKVYDLKWRNACKNSDAIIATSIATKNDIIKYFDVPEQKIHVVYQTCNTSFEQEVSDETLQSTLTRHNLPQSFLLFVGSITERKNVLTLVEAYNAIRKDIQIPLVLVGNGRGHLDKIKNYIQKHNLKSHVRILENVTNQELPSLYKAAKIFIYPSKYEGFGIPLVEAIKCGTPIITSNISSLPEVAGNAGLYVDPHKIESLSDGILQIMQNPDLENEMITKGFEQAKRFNFKAFANDTMQAYNAIL